MKARESPKYQIDSDVKSVVLEPVGSVISF